MKREQNKRTSGKQSEQNRDNVQTSSKLNIT